MGQHEVTYAMDRQGNPALLSKKESIAEQLINAIFLVPGNIPNLYIGLNIEDYLYRKSDEIQRSDVVSKLTYACGEEFMSNNVKDIQCFVATVNSAPTFVLIAELLVDDDEDDTMALVLTRQDDVVKFNYKFISEGVRKAYGVGEKGG